MLGSSGGAWLEPPWDSPLDGDLVARAVPAHATMTGMFLDAVAGLAKDRGLKLKKARERYTPFQPYPLREHCELMLEVSRTLLSDMPLRHALRRLGRGAPQALIRSTLGRVVFGSVEGPLEILRALSKSYSMHLKPSSLEVEGAGPKAVIIHLADIYNFLDSHNVGVFEGALKYANVKGTVKIKPFTRTSADLLCSWE
jgi:uncharacterized protein (TIGR02265 family)